MRKKKILVPGHPYTAYAASYQKVLQSTEKILPSESERSLPIKLDTFVNTVLNIELDISSSDRLTYFMSGKEELKKQSQRRI